MPGRLSGCNDGCIPGQDRGPTAGKFQEGTEHDCKHAQNGQHGRRQEAYRVNHFVFVALETALFGGFMYDLELWMGADGTQAWPLDGLVLQDTSDDANTTLYNTFLVLSTNNIL